LREDGDRCHEFWVFCRHEKPLRVIAQKSI
jgi:hypothetical protein